MIYEIRNYHFNPARLEEYKTWAKEKALPFLDRELDLVGFWANAGDSEVLGEPMDELFSKHHMDNPLARSRDPRRHYGNPIRSR